MSKVYLSLHHGRRTPDESLSDWGPDGPIFGPFDWVHTTYAADVRCGDNDGSNLIELHIDEDCLYYGGMWYGDWSVFAGELDEQQQARLTIADENKTITLHQWKQALEMQSKARFGLELNDIGEEDDFKDAWSEGDKPDEYLDWVKEKRDLTEIKEVM
ncbi:hypothetical protein [Pedosphaera parvula]|uniref:Uncharacterized protein n=1 Tax=Pedosphaera parvula (strain Ellin514) TaxID=320771 RepID=B9XA12_PEDPL|nr:hypothetical protein [Pedosphaera parvula]EEF63353.1 hypothetical protein Cflav_PD5988 [Pedosphaera parvula Ellin514]